MTALKLGSIVLGIYLALQVPGSSGSDEGENKQGTLQCVVCGGSME
jgi:hypothetical protein